MSLIFYLMGKSASGKDTVYDELLKDKSLHLSRLVTYTTRPVRARETEGLEYHFTDDASLEILRAAGKIIEERTYQTSSGPWHYFTVHDKALERVTDSDEGQDDILGIGTLESFCAIRDYFGWQRVIPIYIEVDDALRLERALKRERKHGNHKYEEMCRRFLSDQVDFSEENLKAAGISVRFNNDGDRSFCIRRIASFIREKQASSERD